MLFFLDKYLHATRAQGHDAPFPLLLQLHLFFSRGNSLNFNFLVAGNYLHRVKCVCSLGVSYELSMINKHLFHGQKIFLRCPSLELIFWNKQFFQFIYWRSECLPYSSRIQHTHFRLNDSQSGCTYSNRVCLEYELVSFRVIIGFMVHPS